MRRRRGPEVAGALLLYAEHPTRRRRQLFFSLALATAFGSGAYLIATSLDTYVVLIFFICICCGQSSFTEALGNKFCKAESNVMGLERLGATVLHGIDVNTMKSHTDLKRRRFDRIVYNFPHAGFKGKEFEVQMINLHKELVRGFFQSAHHLLQPYGEIHVNHKTGASYDRWEIERLAAEFSLILVEKVGFQKADYPGYNQKKGDGPNRDKRGDLKKKKKWKRRTQANLIQWGSPYFHLRRNNATSSARNGDRGEGAAPSEGIPPAATVVEGEEETAGAEGEEKWVKHYSSMHSILIVGDGDFSFLLELASGFGSGAFMVATSLDTYVTYLLISYGFCTLRYNTTHLLHYVFPTYYYSNAKSNVMKLETLETTVLYGVDVKRMKFHTDLANRRFDRIIFNFPHAGFKGPEDQVHMINYLRINHLLLIFSLHKELLRAFFCNARHLLMPYVEIHVRHKIGGPYDKWDLEHLASESSLIIFEKEHFQKSDYPGYIQKRGDGARCDQPFNLGSSCTFKFQIRNLKKQKKRNGNKTGSTPSLGGSNVHPPGNLGTDTRPFHPLPSCTFKFQIRNLKKQKKRTGNKTGSTQSLGGSNVHPLGNMGTDTRPFHPLPSCTFKFQIKNLKKQKKRTGNKSGSTPSLGGSNVHPPGNLGTDTRPFHPLPSCTFKCQIKNLKKQKKRTGNKTGSTPSLGGSNDHPPGNLGTDTRPFHPLPLPQAWPWLQFTPSVNTVSMPITLQPGLQLNLDGTVRDSAFHQQPMFSITGPLLNALCGASGIPPLMLMPGAASSSYSFIFLQHYHRESVQRQEWLNRMVAYGAQ
ncbi:hypothetical protein U9M48_014714 [Paspalum notatum var. saurae]|uniref:25S rRNA (uridine-N(3))-methyltransferase BMT5-like domain-containing protein n=1 Tax=Paspalum notatum var. saurae TaxID=547442 RepID=A0AAQ3T1Q3_PASNO